VSEPEEAAGVNMAIDLFDSVQGQEVVLQGGGLLGQLGGAVARRSEPHTCGQRGAVLLSLQGSAERCFSACRAARCGASQPGWGPRSSSPSAATLSSAGAGACSARLRHVSLERGWSALRPRPMAKAQWASAAYLFGRTSFGSRRLV